ncbi:MAG: hypothetical protein KDC84_14685 [Crocinitomicaceae bacterium]|nr:hypothetical protein [Crocinitomicaceae bacterium]
MKTPIYIITSCSILLLLLFSCNTSESGKEGSEEKENQATIEESDSLGLTLDCMEVSIDSMDIPNNKKVELKKDIDLVKEVNSNLKERDSMILEVLKEK